MTNVEKTFPGPGCLEIEKEKKSGDYKCGNVLELLKDDFCNKCYICEEKGPSTINVEHFEPHKGDKEKKFDWKNLYYSCGHCNTIKGHKYNTNQSNRILDCTNPGHDVENRIKCELKPLDFNQRVVVTPLEDELIVGNTAKLLDEVYNGTTVLNKIEAENIREKLLNEIIEFKNQILGYKETGHAGKKRIFKNRINKHLSRSSAFTAFKRCIWRSFNDADLIS